MSIRFSFDLGTSSVGWAVYFLSGKRPGKPQELLDAGVRIYPDGREPAAEGKTGESLAKARRDARGPRRRRDRFLQRRRYLMSLLIKHGLMPEDEPARKELEALTPYAIRDKALSEVVPLHHLGRALFHLNQRRGFKSNRKADEPDEKGKIPTGAEKLSTLLQKGGFETVGAFYADRQAHKQVRKRSPVRIGLKGKCNNDRLC